MTKLRNFGGLTATMILMTTTAGFADVTPAEVWADWQAFMTGAGYTVTGQESTAGNMLTVRDVRMAMSITDTDMPMNFSITIPSLAFTDNRDGTVAVVLPDTMPITFNTTDPIAGPVTGLVEYNTQGFQMTASGTPEEMVYDYTAQMIDMALSSLSVRGVGRNIDKATVTMRDLAGKSTMTIGNLRAVDQTMTVGSTSYDIDMSAPDPDDPSGRIVMNGTLNAMDFTGKGTLPMGMTNPGDVVAMLAAGFAFDAGFTFTGGQSAFAFTTDGATMSGTSASDSGSLNVAMDAGKLAYAGSANGMKMSVMGDQIPFPVDLTMAESAFNLTIPVAESNAAQDFAFGLKMGDFTMSDMIWAMIDPTAQLPRDPATVALDLTGKARMFGNILDPAAMQPGQTPGEIETLTVKDITLRVAGADLTGAGDFTFDATDKATFPGMPRPQGALNLTLVGGNGLLDKLVAMGMLPQDQAMGMRMMMGVFARPGAGDDTLESQIEINGQGHVLANGQRLR